MQNITEKAMTYAIKCHQDTNHKYDDKPYEVHLDMVVNEAKQFIHLLPTIEHQAIVLAGCYVHDVIEDCRQTYNDVKANTNEEIAELAYALTNEKGKTRKDRANDKYYKGIKHTPYATFIKICDRIANYKYSKEKGSAMMKKYEDENINFIAQLYDERYEEMFRYLNWLMNKKQST